MTTQIAITGADTSQSQDFLTGLEKQYDLPYGILNAIYHQEDASGNPNATSDGTHVGPFQQSPKFAEAYGVSDRTNFKQAAEGTAKFLRERYDAHDDNPDQANALVLADYNWGQGNVDKQGLENAPPETTGYIDNITKAIGQPANRPLTDNDIAKYAGSPNTTGEMTNQELQKYATPPAPQGITPQSTEDDIIKAYGGDPAQIKASPIYRPGMFSYANTSAPPDPTDPATVLGKSWVGTLLRGAQDPVEAVGQLEGHLETALGANPANQAVRDLSTKINENYYNQQLKGRQGGEQAPLSEQLVRGIGSMAIPIPGVGPLAEGAGMATKAVVKGSGISSQIARAVPTAALMGAAVSPLAAPVTNITPNGSNSEFAGQKLKQVGEGAAGGAVLGGAGKAITATGSKIVNAIRGKFEDPAAQEMINTANKFGIHVGADTFDKGRGTVEALKSLPVIGTTKYVKNREAQATAGAEQLSAQQYDKMINTKFDNLSEIKKAAANPKDLNRQDSAKKLLQNIDESSTDWAKIVQDSAKTKLFRSKLIADKKYAQVTKLAGKQKIPTKNTEETLNTWEKEAKLVRDPDRKNELLGMINKERQIINDSKIPASYPALQQSRRGFRDDFEKAVSTGDTMGQRFAQSMKKATEDDLRDFGTGKSSPKFLSNKDITKRNELQTAAQGADKFYKENVAPYKQPQMAKLLETNEPDRLYSQFIKAGFGNRADAFYNALDEKGKSAIKYKMVSEGIERASKDAKEGFNPTTYANYMKSIEKESGVFFKGADKWELDGFSNLMAHIGKGSNETWKHAILGAMVGEGALSAWFHSPSAAISGAAAVYSAKLLFTTKAGRNFLLASSDLKPGTPAMQKLWERIKVQLPNMVGNIVGNKEQGK